MKQITISNLADKLSITSEAINKQLREHKKSKDWKNSTTKIKLKGIEYSVKFIDGIPFVKLK